MATPFDHRNQIRDIEQHERVRERGPKARGVRRGLDARGLRGMRPVNDAPPRFTPPSTPPLTLFGWIIVVISFVLVLASIAVAIVLHS
jgi:hypothetical protein